MIIFPLLLGLAFVAFTAVLGIVVVAIVFARQKMGERKGRKLDDQNTA
jgi:hypothetical protein